MKPFFISIPHAGEIVPEEAYWLKGLPEPILFCDSDRYVDILYKPVIEELKIPSIIASCHRYVVDLNRLPKDVDADSVENSLSKPGTHPKGFHWVVTTKGHRLIHQPLSQALHQQLTEKYFMPFHAQIKKQIADFKAQGHPVVYHIDAHSMPSIGEALHVDPGERRADIVISDCKGQSCSPPYLELVCAAYRRAGFGIRVNWPYVGGRITETYGQPALGQQTIQVELNRRLYMDENTKALKKDLATEVQQKLKLAVRYIYEELPKG